MSIRSNSLPAGNDISLQLQDILRKNGIQAHLATDGHNYTLYVQGHDSPLVPYSISRNQYQALADGGTNSSNKHAYKTFVGIVHNDFACPKDFVHARNANGKVTMGLHGYKTHPNPPVIGREIGMHPPGMRPPMLGWTPRQQDGFHMRRVNGELVMQHGMMVPEREGGRMKPGELQSGAYGFYYKGGQQQSQQPQTDPLKDLQAVVKPSEPVEYNMEPAKKYRDLIPSAVYFSNEKWQECLQSHGITVDKENRKLTIRNANVPEGVSYNLTQTQAEELTRNTLKGDSVYHRIDIINGLITNDFHDKLTFDMLNSTEHQNLKLTLEAEQRLHPQQSANDAVIMEAEQRPMDSRVPGMDNPDGINGQSLEAHDKAWYRQIANGREVSVGEIWVEKDQQNEGKYRMSAVINGEIVSHEISLKQHDKFLALDDYHRMKLFDKVFDEVKIKNIPGRGMNFGQALLSSLALVGEGTRIATGIAHDVEHIKHPHTAPEVYVEGQRHGRVYVRAGLDTPDSIAGRIFDAGMNQGFRDAMLHR